MSAMDIWLFVDDQGRIVVHSENDGYAFMRHGAQATETVLSGLSDHWFKRHSSHWFEDACEALESGGYVVDRINKTYAKRQP